MHRREPVGRLACTTQLPQRVPDLFARDGIDLRERLDDGGDGVAAGPDCGRDGVRTQVGWLLFPGRLLRLATGVSGPGLST